MKSLYLNAFYNTPDSLLGWSRTKVQPTDDWLLNTRGSSTNPQHHLGANNFYLNKKFTICILKKKKKMKCIFLKNCMDSYFLLFSVSQFGWGGHCWGRTNVTGETGVRGGGRGGGGERRTSFHPFAQSGKENQTTQVSPPFWWGCYQDGQYEFRQLMFSLETKINENESMKTVANYSVFEQLSFYHIDFKHFPSCKITNTHKVKVPH